ncbi:hypothetical protein AN216_11750, partial [Streptomyces oceani]
MADFGGRMLADRYRLPRQPAEEYELAESPAYDTASGQEVLVRQVPLPEVVEAELLDEGRTDGAGPADHGGDGAARRPRDPAVRRAVEAALSASRIPDHPRLDQVFDVFVEDDGLWIVSELVPARPLAAVLAEERLSAHRAAEIAADLLTALQAVHAQGWVHRNITARSVLVCEDGRALLTGLAAGAAEEMLCGYDALPEPGAGTPPGVEAESPAPEQTGGEREVSGEEAAPEGRRVRSGGGQAGSTSVLEPGQTPEALPRGPLPDGFTERYAPRGDAERAPDEEREPRSPAQGDTGQRTQVGPVYREHTEWHAPRRDAGSGDRPDPQDASPGTVDTQRAAIFGFEGEDSGGGPAARAARRGAIAAYRAGARAASARVAAEAEGRPAPEQPDWWSTAGPAQGAISPAQGAAGPTQDAAAGSGDGPYGPDGQPYGPGQPAEDRTRADDGPARTPAGDVRPPQAGPTQAGPMQAGPTHAADFGQQRWTGEGPTALPGTRHGTTRAVPLTSLNRGPDAPGAASPEPVRQPAPAREPAPAGPPARTVAEKHGALTDAAQPARTTQAETPDDGVEGSRYRGPATALDAERARQARMTVVGAVTERWAPEQAGPVYRNWRLAPPVGPAADLWALGVLLFRALQGHAPYPEDDVAELVQMVCAEPPAFAEECGALRPVVESLLRQDPTERPDFEELRGWLRSLIRTAPEPDIGHRTLTAPPSLEPGGPADPKRLPIKRRRGEIVRKRRAAKRRSAEEKREAKREERQEQAARSEPPPKPPKRERRPPKRERPSKRPAALAEEAEPQRRSAAS